jgi:putative transposase
MPRKPRFYLSGIPAHIVQRGNCRQATFFCDGDYLAYLRWLDEGTKKYGYSVHTYVLTTNHMHLLVTPQERDSISRTIQHVGRHYVTYANHVYGKSGTLWEGRHKGSAVSSEEYLLACMRYIEFNPVWAGMVETPGEYRWSSYTQNTTGWAGGPLTPHQAYRVLGRRRRRGVLPIASCSGRHWRPNRCMPFAGRCRPVHRWATTASGSRLNVPWVAGWDSRCVAAPLLVG